MRIDPITLLINIMAREKEREREREREREKERKRRKKKKRIAFRERVALSIRQSDLSILLSAADHKGRRVQTKNL